MEKKLSYMEPYGLWKVSTEGDCEGRSTRQLGIFRGNYYEIALYLAEHCCYTLRFEKLDENKFNCPKVWTRDEVDVSFADCIGIDRKEMLKNVPQYAPDKDFEFTFGRWDGGIKIIRPRSEDEKAAAIKAKAMEKVMRVLSKEEREALGFE